MTVFNQRKSMKSLVLLTSLVFLNAPLFALEQDIKVMVSCLGEEEEGFIFDAGKEGLEMMLNGDTALGEGGAQLVSEFKLPEDVLTKGSKTSYIFKLSAAHLKKYIELRNGADNPFPEIPSPQSVGEALQDLYAQAVQGCDFYTPSRYFDMMRTSNLSSLESLAKAKTELSSCLDKVENLEQKKANVVGTLHRDTKAITNKSKAKPAPLKKVIKK